MKEMEGKQYDGKKEIGRPPRLLNAPKEVVPRCFYVEVSVLDLKAIIIPTELKPLLVKKLNPKKHKIRHNQSVSHPKISVPIRWS